MTEASGRARVAERRPRSASWLWHLPPGALGTVVGYLGLLTIVAATRRRASRHTPAHADIERLGSIGDAESTGRGRHFAILVPAHDEEAVLADTLTALEKLRYPRERFTIHVIADHCTDRTAAVAGSFEVEVHEHDLAPAGKGPALSWVVDELTRRGDRVDAFVVVDADTIVDAGFLEAADDALSSGATVVQGYYAVLDPGTSPATAFRAAALAVRHYVRPLGRCAIGGSAGLYGNGMVFAADVLRARPWTNHLTEDMELQLELLLDGVRVTFEPRAVVEAEMPATLQASTSQHERWERGRLDLLRRYLPRLARGVVHGGPAGRVAYADAALDQLVPPLSVLAAGTAGWWAVATARWLLVRSPMSGRQAMVATGLGAAEAAIVVASLRLADAPAAAYRGLLAAPRLVAWKVMLWGRALASKRSIGWTRTARNTRPAAG